MIKVDTYIKEKNEFISINHYSGTVSDPMYVEGAIYLKVDEKEVLTLDLWDDVNWLWGYIVTGLEDLIEQSEWTTGFPDQPIDLTFRIDKYRKRMEIELHIPKSEYTGNHPEIRKATANLDEFLTVVNDAGQNYFARISQIGGEDGNREANRLRDAVQALQQQ